ncbi:MAG: response regulator transcription factor [Verrucomicrobia bacterium]|nr:response regulator transcription factor [Verrucomicrobiota bacterium]
MKEVRIFLVDDHQIMREGLRLVLAREPDFKVVGEAADGVSALRQLETLDPDVAVIDIEMPGLDGIATADRLGALRPETKVLILSGQADTAAVQRALRAGVSGFLLKVYAADELVRAIRALMAGEVYFCSHVSRLLAREFRHAGEGEGAPPVALTERELEILRRVADGQSTKEIAFVLKVSTKTIETHRAHLMTKLGIFSIAGLTKYAVRTGFSSL